MSVLPVAIVADPADLADYERSFDAWELVYDAKAAHDRQDAGKVRRMIRVGEPYGPGRERHHDWHAEYEERQRELRKRIEKLADDFIATGRLATGEHRGSGRFASYQSNFEEERAVLDEVARRLREALADPFLVRLLQREGANCA